MSKASNQKIKIIVIYEMLLKDSDYLNPITTSDIMKELEKQGIACERKSLADDLNVLQEYDPDIVKIRQGKGYAYYLDRKTLNQYEVRLLLDMIQSASFLTPDLTKTLSSGIASFASSLKADSLVHNTIVFDKTKHSNEQVAKNIEIIDNAITLERKVSFQYFDLRIGRKRELRKEGKRYLVNPVALIYKNDFYYLVAYHDDKEGFTVYRVDRMLDCQRELQHRTADKRNKSVDTIKDQLTAFGMWMGEPQNIELLVNNRYSNEIYDKFGEKVLMNVADDEHFKVSVKANLNEQFLSWVSMFGDMIKISNPPSAVNEMKKYLFKRFCVSFFDKDKNLKDIDVKELDNIADLIKNKIDDLPDNCR